jgi:uncharacterized protein (DUF2164 family)
VRTGFRGVKVEEVDLFVGVEDLLREEEEVVVAVVFDASFFSKVVFVGTRLGVLVFENSFLMFHP